MLSDRLTPSPKTRLLRISSLCTPRLPWLVSIFPVPQPAGTVDILGTVPAGSMIKIIRRRKSGISCDPGCMVLLCRAVCSQYFPLGNVLSLISVLLMSVFLFISADLAAFAFGMMTSNADLNPTVSIKLTWAILKSVAVMILLNSGELDAL